VSRICDITAHDLARTHVSLYNDDAKDTKGMYMQLIQKAWGHAAHRGSSTYRSHAVHCTAPAWEHHNKEGL